MRKGGNKKEGMAMPTSVALANRQMSLSLTQVNHVSWGKNKRKRGGEERRKRVKAESKIAVWRSEALG